MTSAQELESARDIQRLEARVLVALRAFRQLPAVQVALSPPGGRTRYRSVEAARAAVKVVRGLRGARARKVVALWDQAEDERWRLAMCCDHIARKEAEKKAGLLPAEDLHTEGQIGLYKAALRFDPDRGLRFGTYAKWWVLTGITRAIDEQGREVRITGNIVERRRNINKWIRDLEQREEPYDNGDLAELMGLSVEAVEEALGAPVEAVPVSSPDAKGEDHQRDLVDEDVDILADVERLQGSRWVWWALAQLPHRDRKIIRMLNGLDRTRRQHVLQEVGDVLGITKERVRVLRNRAEARLREMPRRPCPGCPTARVDGLPGPDAVVLDLVWDGVGTSRELAGASGLGRESVRRSLRRLRQQQLVQVRGQWRYDVHGAL